LLLVVVVVVVIVQKNDCVLVEMMMMMDSFFSSFLYIQDRAILNYLYNLFGGKGKGGWEASSRLQVIVFNEFMSVPGV